MKRILVDSQKADEFFLILRVFMSTTVTGKFDFTNFLDCKMPEKGLKTLDQIVRHPLKHKNTHKSISSISKAKRNRFLNHIEVY